MTRRQRLYAIAIALSVLLLARVGQQVYRWQTFAPERVEIGRLEGELETAGLGVVRSQVEADSIQAALEAMDVELRDTRGTLDLLERSALNTRARGSVSGYYRALEAYNRRVRSRNELFASWRESLESNQRFVDRYNLVADSIRFLAESMGELYYPILTPAEIAVDNGWGRVPG